MKDLAESEFVGERDEQNNALPSKPDKSATSTAAATTSPDCLQLDDNDNLQPMVLKQVLGIPEKEWAVRNILSAGRLLGKSCQGALKLAGHNDELQKQGYLFGKHLALAWQACLDLDPFQHNALPLGGTFSLVSAPVLFHLEHDPSLYEEIQKSENSIENIDYHKIHAEILKGPGLEMTRNLQRKHSMAAMNVLNQLPPTDARTALQNIIFAMQDL